MVRRLGATLALIVVGSTGVSAWGTPALAAEGRAHLTIVQAVPDSATEVSLDGKALRTATTGTVIGPVAVEPGTHELTFAGLDGGDVTTEVSAAGGGNTDVVVHLPAEPGGQPRVSTYASPDSAIGAGKARVLVAHTATVAAADIVVDGKVVFENVANGEYATADVPAGDHEAAIFPTGTQETALLGPATLTLPARSLTMVYAYGDPSDDSMGLVSHELTLAADGTVAPSRISTGSAGLAGAATDFGLAAGTGGARGPGPAGLLGMGGLAAVAVAVAAALQWTSRSRRPAHARRAGAHRAAPRA